MTAILVLDATFAFIIGLKNNCTACPAILSVNQSTTSSLLDSQSESYVQAGLKKIGECRTTFIEVDHRFSTICTADYCRLNVFGSHIF